jgi:predicted dehydrogenase
MTILRVGIVGCGEVSQVIHIPTLNYLAKEFRITYLCDASAEATAYCKSRCSESSSRHGIITTLDYKELVSSPNVDVVIVCLSDEYHCEVTVEALTHDKYVLVEKPMALNMAEADRIIEAEKHSKAKVMVGYMRRYAPAFEEAVKLVGGMDQILYARVRDIIGPNSIFVGQSATFPKRFSDYSQKDVQILQQRGEQAVKQALENECELSEYPPSLVKFWRSLGGLGSHDLSAMREILGMPKRVLASTFGKLPMWSAMLDYGTFNVTYESGVHMVPEFDAHIEVYSMNKVVKVQYDSPYIKGLPIYLEIRENINNELHKTVIRKTFEDPYTIELNAFYDFVTKQTPIKTTPQDAKHDLEIFQMIIQANKS